MAQLNTGQYACNKLSIVLENHRRPCCPHLYVMEKVEKKPSTAVKDREEEYKKAPHSFVINRGHVGKNVLDLILDIRRVMEPYTASNLKTRKKNVLKDFITIAGPLNVSHLIMLSKTESSTNLRITRLPRGPTLTFKLSEYSLVRDVVSSLKRHNMDPKQFRHHPLLVLNNFSGEGMHMKLMTTMFQNMFPSINVNKLNLGDVKRTVLFNYDAETKTIEFRHYNIRAVPVGMGRAVKKLIKAKVPDLHNFQDISDFVYKGGNLSESEGEMDGPQNQVTLPQHIPGRGNIKSAQSAIRLTEIGPRMSLQLVKIEEGVCSGQVLYHEFVTKTEEELMNLQAYREKKRKLKEQRKRLQAENVKKKVEEKEIQKEKCVAGMKQEGIDGGEGSAEVSEDDDAEYYRQEVGEEPDPELFLKRAGVKRRSSSKGMLPNKKRKFDKGARGADTREFKKKAKFSKDSDFSAKQKSFGAKQKSFGKTKDFSKKPFASKGKRGHSKVGDFKQRGRPGKSRR